MAQKYIGKVSIVPCGAFQENTFYSRLSVVNYQGSAYIAIQDNENVLPTDTASWYLLASAGNGISGIELIGTSGLVNTYRITFTNGDYYDFSITNGATKTSDLTNDSGFITKEVNDLTNYLLATLTGASIELLYDSSAYTVTANLKNNSGTILNTSVITLPIGTSVINASYSNGVITLTQRNGSNITLNLSDLVPKTRTIAGIDLQDNITQQELVDALNIEGLISEKTNKLLDQIPTAEVNNTVISVDDSAGEIPPKDIAIIGNTSQFTTTGKNLWGGFNYTRTASDVTFTYYKDGTIKANGTASANTNSCGSTTDAYNNGLYITLPAGSYFVSGGLSSSKYLQIYKYENSEGVLLGNDQGSGLAITLTAETVLIVRAYITNTTNCNNDMFYIQVETGNEKTSYEPYTGGQASPNPDYPQDIKVVTGDVTVLTSGKNLFNIAEATYLRGSYGDSIYSKTNDTIRITNHGTALSNLYEWVVVYAIDVRDLKGKTITLSANIKPGTDGKNGRIYLVLRNSDLDLKTGTAKYTSSSSISYDIPEELDEYHYLAVSLYGSINDVSGHYVDYSDIQLEIGSTATTFEPYQGKNVTLPLGTLELAKIGNYADVLFKNSKGSAYYKSNLTENAWYKLSNVGKVMFTGDETENWNKGTLGDYTRYQIAITNGETTSGRHIILSNYFIFSENSNEVGIGFIANSTLYLYPNNIESLDSWLTWLSTHNTIVYYVLVNPTYTQITDTALLSKLEELANSNTYKPITNIYTSTDNEEPNIDMVYRKDLTKMFSDLSNAILSLGNNT